MLIAGIGEQGEWEWVLETLRSMDPGVIDQFKLGYSQGMEEGNSEDR